ncbi:MAG TPA: bifunctional phosphoribosylaminoimidazolecarboxamide formyltransferase/IMP cyclohydrolase, partial [Phycisphaerae bacterium]|nr:bifunctional phosphoribosylaminoimidazolecarboxamide formyltransferase/IMP cyclohydrolase [Phycisphaerae bacterium]
MRDTRIKRALIAVYDKTGIADFARALVDEFGIEIISTGGTARHLKEAGIPVTMVEQVTGFPEMLDGRVKTLHPMIHAAILADRDNPDHMRQLAEHSIKPIDMVVVNLYPFGKTVADPKCRFEDAIEMIDIGGPCMLRAAAKNHRHVVVLSDRMYDDLLLNDLRSHGHVTADMRQQLALNTFLSTQAYDCSIGLYLAEQALHEIGPSPSPGSSHWFEESIKDQLFGLRRHATCAYGENPHQKAGAFLLQPDRVMECALLP